MGMLFLSISTADQQVWPMTALAPGEVNRTEKAFSCVGGKAVNAARTAAGLQGEPRVLGFFGRQQDLTSRLAAEGMTVEPVLTEAPTRRAISVVDLAGESVTELVEEPGPVTPAETRSLTDAFCRLAPEADMICLCGTIPGALPRDFYGQLMRRFPDKPFVVDAHGPSLEGTLPEKPLLVRPNRAELAALLGRPAATLEEVARQARSLLSRGPASVAVGCGADGVVFVRDDAAWLVKPPRVAVKNATGCGDALTGALAWAFARQMPLDEALALAVSCAAASACEWVPGRFDRKNQAELLQTVEVTPM